MQKILQMGKIYFVETVSFNECGKGVTISKHIFSSHLPVTPQMQYEYQSISRAT